MKKLLLSLLTLAVVYVFMTFFVAGVMEKEIKSALSENNSPDFSTELLSYQRHLFSATATSKLVINIDPETIITLNVNSDISHYPHQGIIKSSVQFADPVLAERAQKYFNTTNWLITEEKIDLFSNLTGMLTVASGKYESDSEKFITEPLLLSYQINLNNESGAMQLDWAGLIGVTNEMSIGLNRLQLSANTGNAETQNSDYKLMIKEFILQEKDNHSLLEGFVLKGSSERGKTAQTVDTRNEVELRSYQISSDTEKVFTNNRMKFSVTGLYEPAFELLNGGTDDHQAVNSALVELVHNGAQITLSELNSQTPWGEVDGAFDLTLDQGASLIDIIANPYILFDYISGDASLALPVALLNEPILAEPLQMGVMTGFLLQEGESLNLQTSYLQGELLVNGQVIPL